MVGFDALDILLPRCEASPDITYTPIPLIFYNNQANQNPQLSLYMPLFFPFQFLLLAMAPPSL